MTDIINQILPWLGAGAILYVIAAIISFIVFIWMFIDNIKQIKKMDKRLDDTYNHFRF